MPAVVEFGRTQEDKDVLGFYANSGAVGRAVIAPPDMPAERVAMLRAAFDATMKDAEFLAEIANDQARVRADVGRGTASVGDGRDGRFTRGAGARPRRARAVNDYSPSPALTCAATAFASGVQRSASALKKAVNAAASSVLVSIASLLEARLHVGRVQAPSPPRH